MTLIDVALWIILIALIALVPCGCYFTRSGKSSTPPAPGAH
jgi:hypothetical protein